MLLSLGISPEEIGFDNPPVGVPVKQPDALKQPRITEENKQVQQTQKQVREPASQRQTGTKLTRKYSDNKYDKPEYDAKIEQQTLKALEAMGFSDLSGKEKNPGSKIDANHLKKASNGRRSGSNSGTRMPKDQPPATQPNPLELLAQQLNEPAKEKKKKNVFGLDFEIPDELSELIAKEMKQTDASGKSNNAL